MAVATTRASTSTKTRGAISTAYFFDHHATDEDLAVMVTERDFVDAQAELTPSVSAGELAYYEKVRSVFDGPKKDGGGGQGGAAPLTRPSLVPRPASSHSGAGSAGSFKSKGKAATTDPA